MKSFQKFLSESPQGVGDYSTSGTEGGSYKSFQRRPKTGLGSAIKGAAKNAVQSIKNAGKNTVGSEQKRKPQPYRIKNKEATPKREKGGSLVKRSTSDVIKTSAKAAARQKKLSGKSARPMLGGSQKPDLLKGKKPTPKLPSTQERPILPPS